MNTAFLSLDNGFVFLVVGGAFFYMLLAAAYGRRLRSVRESLEYESRTIATQRLDRVQPLSSDFQDAA